jgi:hypothetical protein
MALGMTKQFRDNIATVDLGLVPWLDSGQALLLVAIADERPIAYAMVHLQQGPDDTWPLGERYAAVAG